MNFHNNIVIKKKLYHINKDIQQRKVSNKAQSRIGRKIFYLVT